MNHNDLSSKLAQVIEQIPRDVLYDFCCSYAESLTKIDTTMNITCSKIINLTPDNVDLDEEHPYFRIGPKFAEKQ